MLLAPATHAVLICIAVLGTLCLGLSLARQKTWAAVLLWAVPIAAALCATDLAMTALASLWPTAAMDGGSGDALRFALLFVVVLIPCEIFYQLATTTMAGAQTVHRPTQGADSAPAGDEQAGARLSAGDAPDTQLPSS